MKKLVIKEFVNKDEDFTINLEVHQLIQEYYRVFNKLPLNVNDIKKSLRKEKIKRLNDKST